MKYTKPAAAIAASLSMLAGPTYAGGLAEPMMEPEVIAEEAAAASGGFIVPLLFLVILAAAVSASSGGSSLPRE